MLINNIFKAVKKTDSKSSRSISNFFAKGGIIKWRISIDLRAFCLLKSMIYTFFCRINTQSEDKDAGYYYFNTRFHIY